MFLWSEVLQVNLLDQYRPNIKPLPTDEKLWEQNYKAIERENKGLKDEISMLKVKLLKMEGKLELLEDREKERGRR
jgi:hypothetical protein